MIKGFMVLCTQIEALDKGLGKIMVLVKYAYIATALVNTVRIPSACYPS